MECSILKRLYFDAFLFLVKKWVVDLSSLPKGVVIVILFLNFGEFFVSGFRLFWR